MFQSQILGLVPTLTATGAITANDPVTAAGAKATNHTDTVGFAQSDAAIGEDFPFASLGPVLAGVVASGSAGITAGSRVTYSTDGLDDAGVGNGFGYALDAGSAGDVIRFIFMHASAA